MFDVDTDDGALNDRGDVVAGPVTATAQSWVEPVPCLNGDGAIARIGHVEAVGGF